MYYYVLIFLCFINVLSADPYSINLKWNEVEALDFRGAIFSINNHDFITDDEDIVKLGYKWEIGQNGKRTRVITETVGFLNSNDLYYIAKLGEETLPGNSYRNIMQITNATTNESKVVLTRIMNNEKTAKVIAIDEHIEERRHHGWVGNMYDGYELYVNCFYVLLITLTLEDGEKIFAEVGTEFLADILPEDTIQLLELESKIFEHVYFNVTNERTQSKFSFQGIARKDKHFCPSTINN